MSGEHLEGVWIEARSGTITLCGDLAGLDPCVGADPAAGYGLEGHLLAAATCARSGADGAFIRRTAKRHGTGGLYDGAQSQAFVRQVLCSVRDEPACRQALLELEMAHAQVVTFDVRDANRRFSKLVGNADVPPASPLRPVDAVTRLRGEFTLSSGAQANSYWETLPAANRFRLARNIPMTDDDKPNIIGVGYGGTYLAAVTALAAGRRPFVVDPSVTGYGGLEQPGTLVDDFVTTGGSFARALATMSPSARSASRCIALYGSAQAASSLEWVHLLHLLT